MRLIRGLKFIEFSLSAFEHGVTIGTAFEQLRSASKESTRSLETVLRTANDGARAIGEKVLRNMECNTERAFDAAGAMARAKSVPEVINLHSSFLQQQMTVSASQSKELLELSAKVAQQTLELMNEAAFKAFGQFKRVGSKLEATQKHASETSDVAGTWQQALVGFTLPFCIILRHRLIGMK